VLAHPAFRSGEINTRFLERMLEEEKPQPVAEGV